MKNLKKTLLSSFFTLVLLLLTSLSASAELKLGTPFTENMVVQHDRPFVIWGWDKPKQRIKVRFEFASASGVADSNGYWKLTMESPNPGGPYELTVTGSRTKTFKNVLSGEVWLASGQSNMGWPLRKSKGGNWFAKNVKLPEVRFLKMPLASESEPQKTADAEWVEMEPEIMRNLSGVAFHYARRLNSELKVPVGIIQSAWGGSKIQAWVPLEIMDKRPNVDKLRATYQKRKTVYEEALERWKNGGMVEARPLPLGGGPNHAVSHLDNGMIHPLKPYAIKGAIWYQGESDTWSPGVYRTMFRSLVESWREGFNHPNLPVYYVQLPNFLSEGSKKTWSNFRHHQSLIAQELPYTDYVVTIGSGDDNDIHPTDKETPGNRLAQLALAHDYGFDIVPGSPRPKSILKVGNTYEILFERVGAGLELRGDTTSTLFLFTNKGRVTPEDVFVEGKDKLIVKIPAGIARVKFMLYASFANPVPVIFNKEGFPSTPFRFNLEGKESAKFGLQE